MSDSRVTITTVVDPSAATLALEFALAQLPPLPSEDEPERPASSEAKEA